MTTTTTPMTVPTPTSSAHPAQRSRRRRGHFGAWRAVTTVPAMVGSLLLLSVLSAGAGSWGGLVVLGWAGAGAAMVTRVGERVTVRVGCGFRRPSPGQAARLAPVWAAALCRCGLSAGEVDLYVQHSAQTNAYAAGRRSVAVTTGVLAACAAHRLGDQHLESVLVHELGHHATRASGFGLVTIWLAAPWRFAARVVIGVAVGLAGRRQPPVLLGAVVVAGVVVAIVQTVQARQWVPALILGTVATFGVVCPLADAALSRAGEYAADRYAVTAGVGAELAEALTILGRSRPHPQGIAARVLSRHPSTARRIEALAGASQLC